MIDVDFYLWGRILTNISWIQNDCVWKLILGW